MKDYLFCEHDLVKLYRSDLEKRGLPTIEIEHRASDVDSYMSDYQSFLQDEADDLFDISEEGEILVDISIPNFESTVDGVEGYFNEYYPVYCLWTNVETLGRSITSLDDFFSFLVASGNMKEAELASYRKLVEENLESWKNRLNSYHGGLKGLIQALDIEKRNQKD